MSDRKRKAAICCLIAASFLAMERRKKRKRERSNEHESNHLDSTMDGDNSDQEEVEDEEEEEEIDFETSNNYSGVTIKVEPGLADEDSISGYALQENAQDPLGDMIDIDCTSSIKHEKDSNFETSSDGGIKIKEEPDFSDDDMNDDLSQNLSENSNEGCSQSKDVPVGCQTKINEVTIADKQEVISNADTAVKNPNEVRDECQVFGDFVAGEMRNLKSENNRKKLKRIIQKVIIEISELED
ncbi:uncharacterized protein [Halyomorpha halys]|uniref:uncharacterized protein n=1 Tax=Halyomorpha halys TaxID=286706 RepID=UPI0006D513D8|nr:uncharacterized protein LOC106686851 [Halyomorpha halys]XP_014285907.1 uncharacterized protein LOC106686851 [Halyomorpha halys]XP_024217572.1 uncharacterized protein LOC106686851 [Halyomorpha halys]